MINAILNGLLSFISSLIQIVLAPINSIIASSFPDLSTGLSFITALFNVIGRVLGWVIDLSCIPAETISILTLTLISRYSLRHLVHGVKLALNWYRKLMP